MVFRLGLIFVVALKIVMTSVLGPVCDISYSLVVDKDVEKPNKLFLKSMAFFYC